jgi:signal transduction histidine kinase
MWIRMTARMADKNQRLSRIVARLGDVGPACRENLRSRIFLELERERSRIATALHAGAGQPLAGIKLNLDILEDWSASIPLPAREAMHRLHRLAESALAEVRSVSHRLHPPDWQTLSTSEAIRNLLDEIGIEASFAETHIDIRDLPAEPEHAARIALYRCAQECVTNVIRHSGATRLEVSLQPWADHVELRVADNGRGLTSPYASTGGLGLHAIRRHAASSGGTCKIESGSTGTAITIVIPLASDA